MVSWLFETKEETAVAEQKKGFFGRLFGGGGGAAAADPVMYNDLEIRPAPRNEGGRWLTAGSIAKPGAGADGDGVHHFVRADTHTSQDEAIEFTVRKAKQIIDEQGDGLFK